MSIHIYLAEDDPDDRELFKDSIHEIYKDTKLTMFDDGERLMHYLQRNLTLLPGIIFLDINIPLKNGKQCLREIRNDFRYKNVPVIMFTTSVNEEDVAFCFENGANLFVNKPANFLLQVEVLREVFALYLSKQLFTNPKEHFVLPSTLRLV
jgi:DNA-binding response OmpR family regulator